MDTVGEVEGVERLEHTSWPEVGKRRRLLVIPVGSCEQHGPHLPTGTDTLIATALAERSVTGRDDTIVGPALTVTASGEHQGFPGTLSIGTAAMETVVVELVRSADWADGVVLVNGHGGNHAPVTAAVERLVEEGRRVLSWWPRVPGGDLHAGRTETSIMLALRPDLVDHARIPPDERSQGATAGTDRAVPATDPTTVTTAATPAATLEALRRDGVRAVSPSGVLGDPSAATAEHGRELLHRLVADLRGAIDEWQRIDRRSRRS